MRVFLSVVVTICSITGAMAEPWDMRSARKALFSEKKSVIVEARGSRLRNADFARLRKLIRAMQSKGLAHYYGAIAVSPTFFEIAAQDSNKAIWSGLLQVTEQLHSPDAAVGNALEACQAVARQSGAQECVLAARILPRRWSERELSLSQLATANFQAYEAANAPKAFAASRASKSFAMADGDFAWDEAIAACNADLGPERPKDCAVVIVD